MVEPSSKSKWRVSRSAISDAAKKIASSLRSREKFVLWMRGELGAGKTTMAGEILRALGVPRAVPVLSPTYTFVNEYRTDVGLVAHLDLYRLSDGDEDSVEGFLAGRDFAGLLIEWPERARNSPEIAMTHELRIGFTGKEDERDLELLTIS